MENLNSYCVASNRLRRLSSVGRSWPLLMHDTRTRLYANVNIWAKCVTALITCRFLTLSAPQFVVKAYGYILMCLAGGKRQHKGNIMRWRFFLGLGVILLFGSITATADVMDKVIVPLTISGHKVTAEVAHTPMARAKGLMYRDVLDENSGMLFVFPRADRYSMWMLNTRIPLSVAFVDGSGIILNIADMMPHTKIMHGSVGLAKYALEVNQGWFSVRGIKAGAKITGLAQAPAAK